MSSVSPLPLQLQGVPCRFRRLTGLSLPCVSSARLLRQRYGFQGEVRATGDVLRDQYLFMKRAGFDAFQVKDGAETQAWIAAMGELSHYYQPAADGTPAVWAQRHAIAAAE